MAVDFAPTKLKTGSGQAVCQVLDELSTQAISGKKFSFKKPVFQAEGQEDDEEVGGDDQDGGEDMADVVQDKGNDKEDEIADFGGLGAQEPVEETNEMRDLDTGIIESSIAPEEWLMEVERVAHKLKINQNTDAKEWRSHLEQTKKYAEQVQKGLPDMRYKLEKISDEVTKALDNIQKKENLLNKTFTGMAGDYKSQAEHTKGLTETYTKLNQSVQDLEAQYYEINEKLNSIQSRMDEHGKSLSDTSPLVKIKKAITQVKNDIRTIDIRIGVVSNTLMQSKLKEKNRSDSEAKGLNLGETEYDMEI